ncbi:tyrosine-type recombinase/integrase [Nocardioides bruguierae]|uniref:Tyrosine-type recombinase/integrase n=1 Tax=Nocardioides bruguierae TaxID=2945102 RepID=A0A9X2DB04_9ACTN|nr:tyrosine-type recombinase/integrase [Nocardioides bruguierae]MCM0622631.1 tyrosine-type recombinase/integrase [Nocardioides bruguierae]
MSLSVRVWTVEKRTVASGTRDRVRWQVAGKRFTRQFATARLADTFRAGLQTASRDGFPFSTASGLPASMAPTPRSSMTWMDLVALYVDARWAGFSPRHRKGVAEALTRITTALFEFESIHITEAAELRRVLTYEFFSAQRAPEAATPLAQAIRARSPLARRLGEPAALQHVLAALGTTLDGQQAANATFIRKRATLSHVLAYAVERDVLDRNPLPDIQQPRRMSTGQVDRRTVVNPAQAQALLAAVNTRHPWLTALFGSMYYAGLRPAEARTLRQSDLTLPNQGWGMALLSRTVQVPGSAWTDDGQSREQRGLKHRPAKATRRVPLHPALVQLLKSHIAAYPLGTSGELFAARTGKAGAPLSPPFHSLVSESTLTYAWRHARAEALTPAEVETPLARRPYDLRHACLSTWLNSGVPAAQVAEWAGHSTRVLLDVYANCLDGQASHHLARIEASMTIADAVPPGHE